jgi:hypothetical protein
MDQSAVHGLQSGLCGGSAEAGTVAGIVSTQSNNANAMATAAAMSVSFRIFASCSVHSRESGSPVLDLKPKSWVPACAGMSGEKH